MISDLNKPTILIVGDYVVDEYWFLVRHHSDVASHTGFVHYRLLSGKDDLISDLCGAGLVARLLYEMNIGKDQYELMGLGFWNEDDTPYLRHLIHSHIKDIDCEAAKATFSLKPKLCNAPLICLITLQPDHPTIRVTRSYHEGAGGLEQIDRVDREPGPRPVPNIEWSNIDAQLPRNVSAIVFYDRGKGAATDDVFSHLRERYPQAGWFVKGKDVSPAWLEKLRGNLKLLVIAPEVATKYNPWNRWLVKVKISPPSLHVARGQNNLPGWQMARERINLPGLGMVGDRRSKNVVLLSDNREVVARVQLPGDSYEECPEECPEKCSKECPQRCFTERSRAPATPLTELGWSSAFFAALVYKMLRKTEWQRLGIVESDIQFALKKADEHASAPVPFRTPDTPTESSPMKVSSERENELSEWKNGLSEWKSERREWKEATSDLGLISEGDGTLRLDVWRGSTQVPGYIALIERKKQIIDEIGHKLRSFDQTRSNNRKPLSILLKADPGSGKTYLARRLAKKMKFSFLGYDITQMVHREELLDIFDMVATKQAESSDPVLVFVDEINASLDGSQVYGAFLSPIEEGVYLRRGNAFKLQPCVWIFAGTGVAEPGTQQTEKHRDILSRMTMIRDIGYSSLKGESKSELLKFECQARLEQVYLAATIMRKMYSDIRMVSYEVLERFHNEDPSQSPARTIANKVADLQNVQYGLVTRRNCEAWGGWSSKEDKQMVKLVFEEHEK